MKNRKAWGLVAVLTVGLTIGLVFSCNKRIGDWQWTANWMPAGSWRVGLNRSRDGRYPPTFISAWYIDCGYFGIGIIHWPPPS